MNEAYIILIVIFIIVLVIMCSILIWHKTRLFYPFPTKSELFHNIYQHIKVPKIDMKDKIPYQRKPVPKKIYRTWCHKEPKGICGGRRASNIPINITQKALPDWEQIIYGDKEADDFLVQEFGIDHQVTKAYNLINPKYGAARADLFRYLIIYKYGGVYLDMKSCITKGPLPLLPDDKDIWGANWKGIDYLRMINAFLPDSNTYNAIQGGEYQNWFLYARTGAPILKEIIETIVNNIYELHNHCYSSYLLFNTISSHMIVLFITGPIVMSVVIKTSVNKNTIYYSNHINKYIKYICFNNRSTTDWFSSILPYTFFQSKNAKNSSVHYSLLQEKLINPKSDIAYIPKVVYFTHTDTYKIPEEYMNNIHKYCSGYEIKIYTDTMCKDFLLKYYGQNAVTIFNKFKTGAHKADFWRYCILYLFGGYYFDIKTHFTKHINDIFDDKTPQTWYTVLSYTCHKWWGVNNIYNGIIVTPPYNPIIKKAIKYIYKHNQPIFYNIYVHALYKIIQNNCAHKLICGKNLQKNNWNCILLQEKCTNCVKKGVDECDRYGLSCTINNHKDETEFKTRYVDYKKM